MLMCKASEVEESFREVQKERFRKKEAKTKLSPSILIMPRYYGFLKIILRMAEKQQFHTWIEWKKNWTASIHLNVGSEPKENPVTDKMPYRY